MGNCGRNDSKGYFAHEGLAVQCCKGEIPVAVWITTLVVAFLTFSPALLLLLALCVWRLACSIKVSLIIRCRIKYHYLVNHASQSAKADLFLVLVAGISNLCLQFYNFVITFFKAAVHIF